MKNNFEKLNEEVISKNLCTHCGTCAGICPYDCIAFDKNKHPLLVKECKECGLCYDNCPGKTVNFQELSKHVFHEKTRYPLGNYKSIYAGRSKDEKMLEKASSGGVVTEMLLSALKKNLIDGAIVVTFDKKQPCKTEVIIARTAEEIINAAQSKYTITPVNSILKELSKEKGDYAIVALPCQVHALRKLEINNHPVMKKIKFILGIYCGGNLHYNATQDLLKRLKTKEENVKKMEYRGGGWPGHFKITLKNGTVKKIPKFHYNYVIPLYTDKRCTYCTDLTNIFSDISVGDLWGKKYESRGEANSIVITRTKKGEQILKNSKIILKKLTKKEAMNSQAQAISFKKTNLSRAQKKGIKYNLKIEHSVSEILSERVLTAMFIIGRTKIAKELVSLVPTSVIGKIFKTIRTVWRWLSQ